MSELILVKPSKILEYKQEYLDFNETAINGSCGLYRYNDFDEWLDIVLSIEKDKLRIKKAWRTYRLWYSSL